MSKELTEFEEEVYSFIKKRRKILTSNIPLRMMGAIPNLKNKDLVEVIKRRTSPWSSRKRKFVKVKEEGGQQ